MKTYEFKIKIRDALKNKIENQLGCTRLVYNLALETKEESFKKGNPDADSKKRERTTGDI